MRKIVKTPYIRNLVFLLCLVGILAIPRPAISQGTGNKIYLPYVSRVETLPSYVKVRPNSISYYDGYFRRHILGEIENTSTSPVTSIELLATFFDTSNTFIAEGRNNPYLNTLSGKDYTCFDLYIEEPEDFGTYNVRVSQQTKGGSVTSNLSVSDASGNYNNTEGWLEITGRITNNGNQVMDEIKLVITLLGSNQELLDCDYDYAIQPTLYPGGSSSFKVILQKRNAEVYIQQVGSFRIQVEAVGR